MYPYYIEKLKEEINNIKKELNQEKEANKVLKASQEQYKKRANYAKNKFYDIKEKINNANDPNSNNNIESQYRLKNTELKNQLKKLNQDYETLQQENNQ